MLRCRSFLKGVAADLAAADGSGRARAQASKTLVRGASPCTCITAGVLVSREAKLVPSATSTEEGEMWTKRFLA